MNRAAQPFEELLDHYFERLLADCPAPATTLGLRTAEGKLGECNLRFHARPECEAAVRPEPGLCGAA